MKTLQYFKDRIGKKIYRDSDGCDCDSCKKVLKEGLLVHDEDHAQYIFDAQNDWASEGILLNYRDEK